MYSIQTNEPVKKYCRMVFSFVGYKALKYKVKIEICLLHEIYLMDLIFRKGVEYKSFVSEPSLILY